LAACTASIDSVRIVLIANWSIDRPVVARLVGMSTVISCASSGSVDLVWRAIAVSGCRSQQLMEHRLGVGHAPTRIPVS